MYDTGFAAPHTLRAAGIVMLSGVLGLAGCTNNRLPAETQSSRPAPSGGGTVPPGPDVPRLPAGLVWFNWENNSVSVYDPDDGHTVYQAPVIGGDNVVGLTVATDGASAVGEDHCAMLVFRWAGHQFTKVAEHPKPGDGCYRFVEHRDGRFWAESGDKPQGNLQVSLDPAQPQTLRAEATVDSLVTGDVTVAGLAESHSTMTASSRRVGSIDISGHDGSGRPVSYTCRFPFDHAMVLCTATLPLDLPEDGWAEPWGNVAVARVDLAAKVVTLEQVMPPSATTVMQMFISPDRKEIFIQTSGGWLRVDRASGQARRVASRLPAQELQPWEDTPWLDWL
ncbi:hypothetical protein ACQP2P_27105 [Dactylosporangium sp. CA-139114]|uniref:hypothetical protein n=1 Tax=Dactylosporangium sp. CA-139114 TaxID=3239931 RepID=UPI003D98F7A2